MVSDSAGFWWVFVLDGTAEESSDLKREGSMVGDLSRSWVRRGEPAVDIGGRVRKRESVCARVSGVSVYACVGFVGDAF